MGTRTFTEVGPLRPVISWSASTSTRRYLARVFTAAAALPVAAAALVPALVAGPDSSAAISRSASSVVILPVESISRIWRRFSFIAFLPLYGRVASFGFPLFRQKKAQGWGTRLLQNANEHVVAVRAHVDVGARQKVPEQGDQAPDVGAGGDGDGHQYQKNDRRQQDDRNPQQEQRNPEPRHLPRGRMNTDDGEVGSHLSASRLRIASSAEISPDLSRASISAREGEGSVSTNCNWPEMRL